ncbi:hypothetical protein SAMN02745157_1743 [Kaistia soli DSM 19436]|uniref:Uncharacterized protein n=1 Tax=Kaistia soli DSM 19436 TaxID=1122133 RepID=A0A1M4Z8U8_9HYPH|nr:DUF6111 family protein [Kaistia soli]SHF14202.1 hypothetical protein SAMN02745157_1743 [Kaistia soli DSM 19436]
MLRFLGFTILCFLLPFLAYGLWRFVRHGAAPGSEAWPTVVLLRLSGAGALAMLLAIAVLVSFSGGDAGRVYHPARMENGQLVPGNFE